MTTENFDYKEFAASMSQQAVELLPKDMSKESREYIVDTVYNFVSLAGEALCNDDSIDIDSQDVLFICQTIAEWTFHKGIDLAKSGIGKDYWDSIMQKIAFCIFEVAKQGILKNIEEELLLQAIEVHVIKVWKKSIEELKEANAISETVASNAKQQSNIDYMARHAAENDERVEFLENIFLSASANKKPSMWLIKFHLKICCDSVKDKFIRFIDGSRQYLQVSAVISFILFMSIILYNKLDEINVLSVIAKNKGPMYAGIAILFICVIIFVWYKLTQKAVKREYKKLQDIRYEMEELINPNRMYERLEVDTVSITVGQGLLQIADFDQEGTLMPRIAALRQNLTDNLGYIIPNIRVMESIGIEPNEYVISIRENIVSSGFVYPEKYMVSAEQWDSVSDKIPEDAIVGIDPADNTQAYWVSKHDLTEYNNLTVISAVDVMINHLRKELIKHVDEILTINDVLKLNEHVKEKAPLLIEDLESNGIKHYDIQRILSNLIKEEVCVKDIVFVYEKLCDYSRFTKNPDELSEKLRLALRRSICLDCSRENDFSYIMTLPFSKKWEEIISENITEEYSERKLVLDNKQEHDLVVLISSCILKMQHDFGTNPVIITTTKNRLPLYRLLYNHFPLIKVISYEELTPEVKTDYYCTIGEDD